MDLREDRPPSMRVRLIFGAAYVIAYVFAFTVLVRVQLGWRPAWLWDARAWTVTTGVSAFVPVMASLGGLLLVPVAWLPRWFRLVAANCVVFATVMGVLAALDLSPSSTLYDCLMVLGRSLGIGAAGGGLIGLLSLLQKDDEASRDALPLRYRHFAAFGVIIVLVGVGAFDTLRPRQREDGKDVVLATFSTGDRRLEVATHTAPLSGTQFGVFRVYDRSRINALIMEKGEWRQLADLIHQTAPIGAAWRRVGAVNDTAPSDRATLTLRSGPALAFDLDSERGPPVEYELQFADVPRLEAALGKVAGQLHD